MRINLAVPFAEKDEAKALGARWDPARKLWYVNDPADLDAFSRWMKDEPGIGRSDSPAAAKPAPGGAGVQARHAAKMAQSGFVTPRTDFSLPDSGPADAAPW